MSQPSQRRRQQPPEPQEQLLSARAAALQLAVNPRTAQLRTRRALVAGASTVRLIAGAYVAPESWWVKTLIERPIRPGRPPLDDWDAVWPGPPMRECLMGLADDPAPAEREREQRNRIRRWRAYQKRAAPSAPTRV